MIGSSIWAFIVGASMISSQPLYVYVGKGFCQAAEYVSFFALSFGYVYGGVAIALIRTILITNPFNISSRIGSRKLLFNQSRTITSKIYQGSGKAILFR